MPTVLIAGAILGFLYTYLFTQLFIARLVAFSDVEMRTISQERLNAFATMSTLPAASAIIAGPITRSDQPSVPTYQPTEAQRRAAEVVSSVPLAELSDPLQILAWARSQAVKDNYQAAADGYRAVLQQLRTPTVLTEAARVFSWAGDTETARKLLDEALLGRENVAPEVRARMTADAATLALYDPPPDGYRRALTLLDNDTLAYDPDGWLHLLRASANGRRRRYEDATLSDAEKMQILESVKSDLKAALARDPELREWIEYLSDPNAPDKQASGTTVREDDLEPFRDEIEKLLEEMSAQAE
jgi:hypothetical protein